MNAPARTLLASALVALALTGALCGCAKPTAGPPAPTAPPAAPTPTDTATPEPTATPATPPLALKDIELQLTPFARGFQQPVFMAEAPDGSGRLFVVEQNGTVKVLRDGKVTGIWLDLRRRTVSSGERGLLGMAFSADFATSGKVYLNYTGKQNGETNVVEMIADDPASDTPKWSEPKVLLQVKQPYANHNGGCIDFAPDGKLVVGMGDGGSGGDPKGNGQNPKALLGKMLKLDVMTGKVEIWQSGVRNPWRFSFDRETGDLWIGEVGQNLWEEIDFAPAGQQDGRNWGWNVWEGNHAFPPGSKQSRGGFSFPVVEYDHDLGQSVTGGYVYRGKAFPELVGTYFYSDFNAGWIAGVRTTTPDGRALAKPQGRMLLQGTGLNVSSFAEDAAGELYVIDYKGAVYRLQPKGR